MLPLLGYLDGSMWTVEQIVSEIGISTNDRSPDLFVVPNFEHEPDLGMAGPEVPVPVSQMFFQVSILSPPLLTSLRHG